MKIAIFHDYFGAIGGGEKVVIEMAKILDADIITTDTDAIKKIDPTVRVTSLGKTIHYPGLKQISATLKFYFCDFSKHYDLFIFSGNWAHYAAHRHYPNIWYCHTPVRAFYDNYADFLKSLPFFTRVLFAIYAFFFRWIDRRSVSRVDHIIANSRNTQTRIRQFYNRKSEIIYPPVDSSKFYFSEYGNFWLSVNRLYPEKRIELQIESFRAMPEQNLVIAGGFAQGDHAAAYAQKLKENIPKNITIAGEVQEAELIRLYAHCRGLICTARDEDFGITPLEAMAAGKPVVAVNSGGYKETLTPQTGRLVSPDVPSIIDAVRTFSRDPECHKTACVERAKVFDIRVFEREIREQVNDKKQIS